MSIGVAIEEELKDARQFLWRRNALMPPQANALTKRKRRATATGAAAAAPLKSNVF
jgi:hypothetical protein